MNASLYRYFFVVGLILFRITPDLTCLEGGAFVNGGNHVSSPDDFSIRLGVEEVRLDVVVVDNRGRQITDLGAEDFQIFQDGKPQTITSSTYIANQKELREAPGSSRSLTREDVHRTIVFIFDNLGMNSTQVYRGQMAIRKFVETQMLPGDLVAIVPTASGNAAMQTFSSDKRELLSMVDNIRYILDTRTTRTTPQLLAYSYCIRALQEMPGRKYLLLLSAQTDSPPTRVNNVSVEYVRARVRAAGLPDEGPHADMFIRAYQNYLSDPNPYYARYAAAIDRIADGAIRAGVVIHSLDIKGVDAVGGFDVHTTQSPLAKRTGGLFVTSNFFTQGIGEVNEQLKGYYLLSYVPPPRTFTQSKDVFHRLKVKVRRSGSIVHAREGFYADSKMREGSAASGDPLMTAMLSPFRHGDLAVGLTSGYVDDSATGYLLQALLHLDVQGIQVADQKDGRHSISFEVVGSTLDINGDIHDSGRMERAISLSHDELSWIMKHGLRCSLSIPSKEAGSYYVRVAVRDKTSGKIGSAYRFVEIPDLKKGELALSSIFFVDPDEDASADRLGMATGSQDPILVGGAIRIGSPTHISFRPGGTVDYVVFIYNAKGIEPDLEFQFVLFRDGDEIHRSELNHIDVTGSGEFRKIMLRKSMHLGNTMKPGNYTLQLIVRDKQGKGYGESATQTTDFTIKTE